MSKPLKLTDKQITDLSFKIGKPIYKFINKCISRELNKFPNHENIECNDFVNIIILTMSNLDVNVLSRLRTLYKQRTNHELDFVKLMIAYVTNLNTGMTKDEEKRFREKMN